MKYNGRLFDYEERDRMILVSIGGKWDDPESDTVLVINKEMIPQLIATLKLANGDR